MIKDLFIQQYVVVFLATWTANNYDNSCAAGRDKLNHPPVEDAHFLANKAWEEMQAIMPDSK